MRRVRIWAPYAKTVELHGNDENSSMTAAGDGTWSGELSALDAATEYAIVLDGSAPMPDPRSSWQARGVHGPSRFVDHSAFHWTDETWQARPLSGAVIYELHIGTFTPEGTFRGAIEKLNHLKDLGVTHVELMPVAQFSGSRGWGYDGVGLYAPHCSYGEPDELKLLINACHERGLAALLDVVYNHLGPSGNYLPQFGPYFTDGYLTPWGQAVNFDGPESFEVRRFICDNALMWLRDYHFDGLRLDAVHAIFDSSAVHILEQLACEVADLEAQTGRHLVLIAESDLNDPRVVRPQALGGYGIHAQWSDDFHHALHTILTGERDGYYAAFGSLADLAKALQKAFVYDGRYSKLRRRTHGRPATGLSGHSFLGYLQNHDQIGNRANGERISHLISVDRLKVAAALVMTAPFIPMLFQGEEWGASSPFLYFTDHEDPELGRAVTEGRRREFASFREHGEQVPDPQALGTFERSKLIWAERQQQPHATLLDWHRRLIRLRRETPSLSDGRFERLTVDFDEQSAWLVVKRGPIAVVCNLAESAVRIPIGTATVARVLLASHGNISIIGDTVELPSDSVAVLRLESGKGDLGDN